MDDDVEGNVFSRTPTRSGPETFVSWKPKASKIFFSHQTKQKSINDFCFSKKQPKKHQRNYLFKTANHKASTTFPWPKTQETRFATFDSQRVLQVLVCVKKYLVECPHKINGSTVWDMNSASCSEAEMEESASAEDDLGNASASEKGQEWKSSNFLYIADLQFLYWILHWGWEESGCLRPPGADATVTPAMLKISEAEVITNLKTQTTCLQHETRLDGNWPLEFRMLFWFVEATSRSRMDCYMWSRWNPWGLCARYGPRFSEF